MSLTFCFILAMAGHYAQCGQIGELFSAKIPEKNSDSEEYLLNSVTSSPRGLMKPNLRGLLVRVTLQFAKSRLEQIVEDLQTLSEMRIVIDTVDLRRAAFDFNCPVSLEVEDVPFCTALRLLLKPLDLDYSITPDAIVITTPPPPYRK